MTDEAKSGSSRAREIVLVNRTEREPPSRWDQLERFVRILSLVGIPVVLAVGGWWIQDALSRRSVNEDYVALAVSILTKPDQESDPALRAWAVNLLNANSPVKFDPETSRKLVVGQLKLPVAPLSSIRPITALPEDDPRKRVSRSIGKLEIRDVGGATYFCTAWLISASYLMTADYCVSEPATAITFHLGASADGDLNSSHYEIEPVPTEVNRNLGYAVLKAKGIPGKDYGYLSLTADSPKVGEPLFLAHYAGGGSESFSAACKVIAIGPGNSEFSHDCETMGGVGGAPLVRLSNLAVIGLHYTGTFAGHAQAAKRVDTILSQSKLLRDLIGEMPPTRRPAPEPAASRRGR